MTLLLAEGDRSGLCFLKEALAQTGIKILEASSGEDAVFLLRKTRKISLVLLDMNLAKPDSFETLRRMRKEQPDMPVIGMITRIMPADLDNYVASGCDDLIAKPVDVPTLLKKIQLQRSGVSLEDRSSDGTGQESGRIRRSRGHSAGLKTE